MVGKMKLSQVFLEALEKKFMSKAEFTKMFKEEILSDIDKSDKPAIREAWNNTVDAYIKDNKLPEKAGDWSSPFGR